MIQDYIRNFLRTLKKNFYENGGWKSKKNIAILIIGTLNFANKYSFVCFECFS